MKSKRREFQKELACVGVTGFLLLAGTVMGVWSQKETSLHFLDRPAWGEGETEQELLVKDKKGKLQEIRVRVEEQQYTREEARAFVEEAKAYLWETSLGENTDWEHIQGNLSPVAGVPGLPVDIYWDMGEEEFFDRQGRLCLEKLPPEGATTWITAVILCQEEREDVEIRVKILPPMWTKEELWRQSVEKVLQSREREQAGAEKVELPGTVDGEELAYYKKTAGKKKGGEWFLFSVAAGGLLYAGLKKEEKEKRVQQQRQLLAEYPAFVEKLLLYLGAGVSLRNIFFKLEAEEQEKLLGKELVLACRRLKNGEAEGQVYIQFGERIGLLPYIRLGALLSQNLRSGTREIMEFLEREVEQSFYDRKEKAKQRGEEIGVKLLLPMGILLFLCLGVIIVPAFMQF